MGVSMMVYMLLLYVIDVFNDNTHPPRQLFAAGNALRCRVGDGAADEAGRNP